MRLGDCGGRLDAVKLEDSAHNHSHNQPHDQLRDDTRRNSRPKIFRNGLGVVVTWLAGVVGGILALDAVLRGAWLVVWRDVPWVALVVWLVWALLYRPCVRAGERTVKIINPGVIWSASWSEVTRISAARLLTIDLANGTQIVSWGAPAGPRQRDLLTKDVKEGTSRAVVSTLQQYRDSALSSVSGGVPAAASRHLDWLLFVSGGAIVLACVLSLFTS